MRHIGLASVFVLGTASAAWIACSSSSNPAGPGADGGAGGHDSGGGDDAPNGGNVFALNIPCTDSVDSVYGDPGTLPSDKGAIIKCATEADLSKDDVQTAISSDVSTDDPTTATNTGYVGKPATSGAHVYRILYRTERGDSANTPGYSSAKVYVPTAPRKAGPMPLVVGARGSRGQGPACTASKEDPVGAKFVEGDYHALGLPLVGAGYAVIIPDLAGYANYGAANNPPSAYAQYLDVGKSTLDGARAFAKMFPGAIDGNKIVLVGHSQGGHSALASLAVQPQYAPELKVAAVATYSPLWIAQSTWAALFVEANSYPINQDPSPTAVAIWYHYTHGELLDGPGHGLDAFAPAVQATIKHFVDNDCWYTGWDGSDAGTVYPDLQDAGKTALDFFSPSFVSSVKFSAALGNACNAGDDVCAKWSQRYQDDRPHLTGTTPLLIEYGASDTTIPPTRMACVIDRLKNQDKVPYTFCLNPSYGHTGVVRATASYVADWIGATTLGEPAPTPCAMTDANLVDDAGAPIGCAQPPPNN
jgi:pimeloyl-ACP methyl ester carboxylesterase